MTAVARSITGSDRVSTPRSSKTLHQNKRSGCWQSAATGGSDVLIESLSKVVDEDLRQMARARLAFDRRLWASRQLHCPCRCSQTHLKNSQRYRPLR